MNTNKLYDNQVIRIGIFLGLVGGGIMVYLNYADFGLYYFHAYLFIFNYLLTMFIGIKVYKKLKKDSTTFLKRFTLGFLIYSVTTVCFAITSNLFNNFASERTFQDKISVLLLVITIGILLSFLLAISFNARHWK